MINISEEIVNSMAPNENSIANSMGLVKKNKFMKLYKSSDETLIFGECKGSGEMNYITSADFIVPENPSLYCTCPSRQHPCKHSLGLLYAYLEGKIFEASTVPELIEKNRIKILKREERKKEELSGNVKKHNLASLKKKVESQIEGLKLLKKILENTVTLGLGSLNPKTIGILEEQIKLMGEYYLNGIQTLLKKFIYVYQNPRIEEDKYMESILLLLKINSILNKGQVYLESKLADPIKNIDTESLIEEYLGHSWQLSELREFGLIEQDAELLQVSFTSYKDDVKGEFVDLGVWVNLKDGNVQKTFNYRPYKAAKFLKEEDSVFSVVCTKELYLYPGEINRRGRWDNSISRDISSEDIKKVKSFGNSNLTEIVKKIKNSIKNSISDKYPYVLIKFKSISRIEDSYVLCDCNSETIVLKDDHLGIDEKTIDLLSLVDEKHLENNTILGRFHYSSIDRRLYLKPLTIITDEEIIRLTL